MQTWAGVTWGLVQAFKAWQLQQGYAIGSINGRLSTVRTYAELAAKAGAIGADELRLIQTVKGYAKAEAENVDDTRRAAIAYIAQDAPAEGILCRRSCKGTGKLSGQLSAVSA